MTLKKQTVYVGLSGGVDSSVAALRLKNQGYNVVGVFIKVWHPDFMVCNWEAERLDAMRVAAHLDIPFLTCDAIKEYKTDVADYFISEYKAGRTPNPDVMCNRYVKFGAFVKFAKAKGADFIATGHYAQKLSKGGIDELHRGVDTNKDQTYFLWTLTAEQLAFTLFPIGDTPKDAIREEALAAGIPTAAKKDSQGICFLGQVDIPEFLSHYIDLKEGNVLDIEGEVIGKHKGALVYTLGQRHGFTVNTNDSERKMLFVTATDISKNTVTVTADKPILEESSNISLTDVILRQPLKEGDTLDVQTRYRQTPFKSSVKSITDNAMVVTPDESTELPAIGQSCVLYRDSLCLGGGIVI